MAEQDVPQDSSPAPVVPAVESTVEVPGSKTPEPNLKAALDEERNRRKEAEAKMKLLEDELAKKVVPAEDIYSDEGKVLKQEIGQLKSDLDRLHEEREKERLFAEFPVLKDKSGEFDEFAKDYPRHALKNVAKLFLAEKDLLGEVQPRKGLEKPTAGPKEVAPKHTVEDVANLRKTNYRKYVELLRTGQINPNDIR